MRRPQGILRQGLCSSETENGGRKVAAVGYKLFCIEENRKEEAEKTPSTCSTNQGNQYFSHLIVMPELTKFRTIKCFWQLVYRQHAVGYTKRKTFIHKVKYCITACLYRASSFDPSIFEAKFSE